MFLRFSFAEYGLRQLFIDLKVLSRVFFNSASVLLNFSWIEFQMLLMRCLIQTVIIILRHILLLVASLFCRRDCKWIGLGKKYCYYYFKSSIFLLVLCLQSFTKYLRLTLVFKWNSALWEKVNFYFSIDFY